MKKSQEMKTLQEIKIDVVKGCKPHYVYLLFKPDGMPFYVGKGRSNRISAHEAETRYYINGRTWKGMNFFKLNTIKKIWQEGGHVHYQIDSWHDDVELAGSREVELVEEIGRRILGTGPLTNIRDGGDLMTEKDRRILGDKIRQFYIDHPEARELASLRLRQFYIDHPEIIGQISQSVKTYITKHPEFIESLQKAKNQWIAENPEEYADMERRRIETCSSSEHRTKVSEITEVFYANLTDEERLELRKNRTRVWQDNPVLIEESRQRAVANKSHLSIVEWLKNEPEKCREKWDAHSNAMKLLHRNEPERAAHMTARRNKTFQKKKQVKQQCMLKVRDRLVALGEIGNCEPTVHRVKTWANSGLLAQHFPDMPDRRSGKTHEWEQFLIALKG